MAFNLFFSNKKESEDKNAENTSAVLSSLSNVIIHTMPKRFLHQKTKPNKKSHSLGLIILIVGAFAILAIFVVLYVYLSDASLNQAKIITEQAVDIKSPKSDSLNVDEKEDLNIAKENLETQNSASQESKSKTEDQLKKQTKINIATTTKDDVEQNKIEIATTTEIKKATSTSTSMVTWTLASDSDGDKLFDAEETLLGLNKNHIDSDGDTYDDFSEFLNMYNPAGEGKISAHPNISRYYNSSYFYSFYYPLAWTVKKIDGDKSIMFEIENNQFVQIIAIDNPDALDLDDWYKKEFDQTMVRSDRRIYKAGWKGSRSNDDLTAYLQKNGKANIYTVSYNLGIENTWSYKNIFELILKSFNSD